MRGTSANLLIGAGMALVLVGLVAKTGTLGWFGHLPGDIRIERDGFRLYVPLSSMLLVSLGLSAFLAFIRRLLS